MSDATISFRITRLGDDDDVAKQIEPHMRKLGEAIGARMQRLVPKRTWALHDTISATTERNGGRVTTRIAAGSPDVRYALYVERGTSRMAAQPYMRPALLQSKAGDLDYSGTPISRHGVASLATRRQRVRNRFEGKS